MPATRRCRARPCDRPPAPRWSRRSGRCSSEHRDGHSVGDQQRGHTRARARDQPERLRQRRGRSRSSASRARAPEQRPAGEPEPPPASARAKNSTLSARRAGEQAVRAGLLRVPDEEGMDARRARPRSAPPAARRESRPPVRDRDDRGAGERRQRPQPDLPEPEEPAPTAMRARSRDTASPRSPESRPASRRTRVEQRDGHELVEPEALRVECREAQHAAERRSARGRPHAAQRYSRRAGSPLARDRDRAPSR